MRHEVGGDVEHDAVSGDLERKQPPLLAVSPFLAWAEGGQPRP